MCTYILECEFMKTKVVMMEEQKLDYNSLEDAANVLRSGGLVVFPTETVYGLGANALDSEAVRGIFQAKGRPQDNPLIIHVASLDIGKYVSEIPEIATKLMEKYWPGPMTIILKKSELVPGITSAGLNSIGIRMPKNKIALELIKKAGVPIAAPSANISGRPSPTEVSRCIDDLQGRVDYIIGGEKSEVGLESTIIDCTVSPPCVLRPGGITLEMLKEIDEDIYIDPAIMKKPDESFKPKAPGMKYRHYAPKAQVKIVEGELQKTIAKINEIVQNYIDDNKVVGIVATDETIDSYPDCIKVSLGSRNELNIIAYNLFEVLRTFDDKEVDIIISEAFEEKGVGIAIMNRLRKAAAFDIIRV
jgi:L-threonylcarbamoyladenylate synthase